MTPPTAQLLSKGDLASIGAEVDAMARDLEQATPQEIVQWAAGRLGVENVTVTCSFGDAVLAHVAASAVPGIEIVMIDTQYLFAETHWFAQQLQRQLDLNLRIIRPLHLTPLDDQWRADTTACCHARKVAPLNMHLADRLGWVSGVRRDDSPDRADAQVLSYDEGRNIIKVNPIALMTDADVDTYIMVNELPVNPLTERGYPSVGCWPCTLPVKDGQDKRSGRWSGESKTECGLHI